MPAEYKFHWKCSFMGCDWWQVYGPDLAPGGVEMERRHAASDYELSIANGEDVRREMLASIGTVRMRCNPFAPLPAGLLEAFHAHLASERENAIQHFKARGMWPDVLEFSPELAQPLPIWRDRNAC